MLDHFHLYRRRALNHVNIIPRTALASVNLDDDALEIVFLFFSPVKPRDCSTGVVLEIPVVVRPEADRDEERDATLRHDLTRRSFACLASKSQCCDGTCNIVEGNLVFFRC